MPRFSNCLAKNPKVDRAVLARIAKTNAATAARRREKSQRTAGSDDGARRPAAIPRRESGCSKIRRWTWRILARLAADKDVSVRKALAQGSQARRLPAADLTRLIADRRRRCARRADAPRCGAEYRAVGHTRARQELRKVRRAAGHRA